MTRCAEVSHYGEIMTAIDAVAASHAGDRILANVAYELGLSAIWGGNLPRRFGECYLANSTMGLSVLKFLAGKQTQTL